MLDATASSTVQEQPVDGTHMARVAGVVDLGIAPPYMYEGELVKSAHNVEITYELGTSLMEDGRPFWVSESAKLSNYKTSKLTKRMDALDPSGAITNGTKNTENFINIPAMVDTKVNAKGYANVRNVGGVPAGIEVKELSQEPLLFFCDDPSQEAWDRMRKFTQNRIRESLKKSAALEAFLALQGDAGDY